MASQLKVMTWNIWGKLNQHPRYIIEGKTARQRTIEIIQASEADVVAMIETYGSAADIAEQLGFHFYTPSAEANLCIFSRYPISDAGTPEGLSSFSFIAATINLPDGGKIRVYDIWLTSSGRHIVEVKNKDLSDEEFVQGDEVRHLQLKELLAHEQVRKDIENSKKVPLIVAGDFNCVSHLDYTEATKNAGLNNSRILTCPVSIGMANEGFIDTYRHAHPEVTRMSLGHTWTTVGQGFVYEAGKGFVAVDKNPQPEYRDPYARIDFVYAKGNSLLPRESTVITHHPSESEHSFPEFPSDHAAVLTTFSFGED